MPASRSSKVVALPVQSTIVVARIARDRWLVEQNGKPLVSPSGSVRKFSTERRALLAAQRAAGIVVEDRRNSGADALVSKLRQATPEQLAAVGKVLA
jgi:hypothetical protein